MHRSILAAIAAAALTLAACASLAPAPPPEASRSYPGVSRDQVLQAAGEVLRLADPAFAIERRGDAIEATRARTGLAFGGLPGYQHWRVTVEPAADGAQRVTLDVYSQAPRASMALAIEPLPDEDPAGAFTLFFARLDQRLGRRADWTTCEEAAQLIREGSLRGSVHALCWGAGPGFDALPAGARISCPPHRPHLLATDQRPEPVCVDQLTRQRAGG